MVLNTTTRSSLRCESTPTRLACLLADFLMSGGSERPQRWLASLILDEHVVRVECRNREDRNLRFRQRLYKRRKHPRHRKRKRPLKLQCNPAQFSRHSGRRAILRVCLFRNYDRNFIRSTHYAEKMAVQRPRRDRGLSRKPAYSQALRKNAKF
jgi:hypothetical protein